MAASQKDPIQVKPKLTGESQTLSSNLPITNDSERKRKMKKKILRAWGV
jgi:hypothetical protein